MTFEIFKKKLDYGIRRVRGWDTPEVTSFLNAAAIMKENAESPLGTVWNRKPGIRILYTKYKEAIRSIQ